MKRTYTEKMHAQRLIKMLSKKDICNKCPATPGFKGNINAEDLYKNSPCVVCKEFIRPRLGLFSIMCPCGELGSEKAIKRTWLALEEKEYL